MAVRRGVVLILVIIVLACLVSLAGVLALYLLIGREPTVAQRSTLVLRVSGDLPEGGPDEGLGQFLPGTRQPTLRGILENLRKAKVDPRISGALVLPNGIDTGYWAKLQEIHDAIIDFKRANKFAVAFLEYGGDREYYVATACDRIFLLPSSPLNLTGLAMYELFLRGTLEKIGAYPDLMHIGDYKTAPNLYTEKGFTAAHQEMDESLNLDMYEQLVRGVADGRKKGQNEVRTLLDQGPFLPEDALSAGLVDYAAYEDEIEDKVKADGHTFGPKIEADEYLRVSPGSVGLNRGPRIALLYITGLINSGRSGIDPLNGPVAGSDTIVDSIHRIRDDGSIRAVVVRIDSPGGASTASDVIWRELVLARDRKRDRPLVASMSDLAASGGYYVAMAAPTIVAEPGTLTGSIGIYGGKIVTSGTFAKLGANIASVSHGRNAEMNSAIRPYTPEERAKLEEQLRAFYIDFVDRVGQARQMKAERVDEIAQGRVWTGRQAREIKLVDRLGGLDQAIALAKEHAKIPRNQEVEIVTYPPRRSLYELLAAQFSGNDEAARIGTWLGIRDRRALGIVASPLSLFRRGEPLALMPFALLR